jgi:hypothetical protein
MISIYDAPGAASALTSGTAKTVIAVTAPAQFGVNWMAYELSFDGSTSTATPARIELCTFTAATAGTNTSVTIVNSAGQRVTTGFTAGTNYTAEPTVLAACDRKFAKGDLAAMDDAQRKLLELGGGQYVSSPRHTLGDLVRDAVGG